MLSPENAEGLFSRALSEFSADWEIIVPMSEVASRDPDGWLSGIWTFGTTLRHRTTGAIKVLGRRHGGAAGASYHRGISHLVLQAYGERNIDPVCRYLEEVGLSSFKAPPRPLTSFRAS
jgi:hypothetical protein